MREFVAEETRHRERYLLALAGLFVLLNSVALSWVTAGTLAPEQLLGFGVWAVLMAGVHLVLNRQRPEHDPFLLPVFGLLLGWGIILIGRLAPNFANRHLLWVIASVGTLLFTALLPHQLHFLRRHRYILLISGLLLLSSTFLFGVNPSGFGARLWLCLCTPWTPAVYVQPSEVLKLILIIFLASYFADREPLLTLDQTGRLGPIPYLAPLFLMWGLCMAILVWQRDLGPATLIFFLFVSLLYLATGEIVYVISGTFLLLLASVLGYLLFDVVALRVDAWWNPWPEADGRAFQIVQSLYAIASGGILGQGVGQGFPDYIPVVHSDFAFAAIAEEWGLIGSLGVIFCFALLTQRGLRLALLLRHPFKRYLAAGITVLLTTQALMIMGGVIKALPLTGVTLPFVSYGGSSLVMSSAMLGLLLYLSSDNHLT